ncbi:MAG TPA: glycosyltransferase family 2 protein [Thermoanaerobaculia bacterium]|nr:glycosyltransferase family 2 protein [Thermoanaerobaculia bacterium]
MAIVEISSERAAPVAAPEPELSILIVTWNSQRWIERCLRSIPAACAGVAYETILYDNSSQDRTLQLVHDDVRLIASQRNDGFAGAINRAIGAARGPFVFLLNPDCELGPRSVTSLVDFLRSHPAVAAVAPLLADERGDSQRDFQIRRFPTLPTFVADLLALNKMWPSNPITASYRCRDLDLTQPRPVDQPAAAALLLRREVFDEIGPLDEQFSPAWFEDVDYCRRLAAAGKEIWIVPAAQAKHFGGASLENVPFARFIELWYRNMWRYARKWFTPLKAEMLRWFIMLGMILRLPAALLGIAHREVGRAAAFEAYMGVLKRALERWDDASPSS